MAAIFFYHGCDWTDLPARQQYLMRAMSRHLPVVFLDGGTDRLWQVKIRRPEPNFAVVRGLIAVCQRLHKRGMGGLARAYSAWHLRKLPEAHGRVIFWCAENWLRPYRFIRHDALIYDCIDPCFDPSRQAVFDQRDRSLARDATLVFATAQSLLERMKKENLSSYLLPNGCCEAEYDPAELVKLPRPRLLENIRTPVIGYMGSFDWRIDTQTIAQAAQRLPEFTFALVGRVNTDQEARVRPLRELPNVILPGSVSVQEGRAYVGAFDVGIIPFLPGEIGDAINPVKMHMYLMAGKPVVSTWLAECRRYAPWVTATNSPDEFAAAIRNAVAEGAAKAAARTAFGRENSWSVRAAQAVAILCRHGLLEAVHAEAAA
jgi:O-antigen biosynthesis protein